MSVKKGVPDVQEDSEEDDSDEEDDDEDEDEGDELVILTLI